MLHADKDLSCGDCRPTVNQSLLQIVQEQRFADTERCANQIIAKYCTAAAMNCR